MTELNEILALNLENLNQFERKEIYIKLDDWFSSHFDVFSEKKERHEHSDKLVKIFLDLSREFESESTSNSQHSSPVSNVDDFLFDRMDAENFDDYYCN